MSHRISDRRISDFDPGGISLDGKVSRDTRVGLEENLLWKQGGYALVDLLNAGLLDSVANEAFSQHRYATTCRISEPGEEETGRGHPDRWLESAPGGPRLAALYSAVAILEHLYFLTDIDWEPSGLQASYSYYRGQGHYLGLHRDVEECNLAVIACVYENAARENGMNGALCLYPTRSDESLTSIRATPEHGAQYVRMIPGQAVILYGGTVPHSVVPLGANHVRLVAPLCYTPKKRSSGHP